MMKLADLFADHMVLQRQKPIAVFGTGAGAVRIEFCGKVTEVSAQFAHWCAFLPAEEAGGPFTMTVTLTETGSVSHAEDGAGVTSIVLHDVMVGEVWLAGGQSNMSMALQGAHNLPEDLTSCPSFRYYSASRCEWTEGTESLDGHWTCCEPSVSGDFSAIAYYFARSLCQSEQVAVGILCCCKGASRIESWIDPTLLAGTELDIPAARKFIDRNYPFNPMGMLYYRMLSPLAPFSLRGVLWYQGESDRSPSETIVYSGLFGLLLKSWRRLWGDALPFLTVQLTAYGPNEDPAQDWPTLRSQQLICTEKYSGVAMITSMDVGSRTLIHPIDKKPLGERLALAAQNIVYGRPVEYCGPVAVSAVREGSAIRVAFSHAENGLLLTAPLGDLELCGMDGNYSPAEGTISADGKTLLVRAEKVPEPRNVRYAWRNFSMVTLCNAKKLPASPFRLTAR